LAILPSFTAESAVYIVQDKAGNSTVISRSFKHSLWADMTREIQREAGSASSYSLGPDAQARALKHVRIVLDTRTAPRDKQAADTITDACRNVLLRVRYTSPGAGADGTSYHAGHWIRGAFLAGQTWSPDKGTIASDFVEMETTLKAYADADANKRALLEADLLKKARALRARL
jgi:hypothetical protein